MKTHNEQVRTACLVVPTYNESKNIIPLLKNIFLTEKENFSKEKVSLKVLVVDDSSPDGTARIVLNYKKINSKNNSKVFILIRKKKEGLGMAYIAGMKYAIKKLNPDVIFEMDADHSHSPKNIYQMIRAIKKGADFVIGSRYVSGGGIEKGWGMHRYVISTLARSITRIGLNLGQINDCSGGYRAIRSTVLKKIDLDNLEVKGYAFQAALLEATVHEGFKVVEVPIFFNNRNSGNSKMRFSDMLEGFSLIYKIRKKRFIENFKGEKK